MLSSFIGAVARCQMFLCFHPVGELASAPERIMANDRNHAPSLDTLRREIDAVDNGLQDLLVRRTELVDQVAGLKRVGSIEFFRPGREAQILRRLVGRHRGRFPRGALVRIWREIIMGGTIALQAELAVAACEGCRDLARDHFGTLAPLLPVASADEAMLAVAEGRVALGVLPRPGGDDPDPWWLRLAAHEGLCVVARLPFGALANAEMSCGDALVIAAAAPEASGDDCTLVAIVAPPALGAAALTDLFRTIDIDANPIARCARADGTAHLVELGTFIAADDRRLDQAAGAGARVRWLGAYARPLSDAVMGRIAPR
jgi:chorismate mutase / prephenate dehydratase